jgi:hypothetical protein
VQKVSASDSASWVFFPVPSDPQGDYTFSAAQTNVAPATGAFTVVAATVPRIVELVGEGAPGTTFRFGLAGFEDSVTLYLYKTKPQDSEWTFLSTLPTVTVESNGEAIFLLESRAGDPPGQYAIVTDPSAECNPFQIQPTPPCAAFQITG